jgi:putative membrane protein
MNMIKACLAGALAVGFSGMAAAADPPATSEVLQKLHHSDQKEIALGKVAQKNGKSKDVKDYGKTLVKDHTAADKKVAALAKQEGIDLPAESAKDEAMTMPAGPSFDANFGKMMLDDHTKDVADATAARDSTKDEKLRKLLTDVVPVLQKHKEIAQKIVDQSASGKTAASQ